jgi:adenine C2-methylase RlmN of 23S rRNA A2503 and tRNA A37
MTEISKDKVVQKLAEMFEEEWYTNRSQYEDDDGNETKEFKELQEIETVVNKMIIKYYDK